jgi:hypothetical protein
LKNIRQPKTYKEPAKVALLFASFKPDFWAKLMFQKPQRKGYHVGPENKRAEKVMAVIQDFAGDFPSKCCPRPAI